MSVHGPLWIDVGAPEDIPLRGARVVRTAMGDIALFRASSGEIFALEDKCPHLGGPLSQGIVHDRAVTCPLHNLVIDLDTGRARGPDALCVKMVPTRVKDDHVYLAAAAVMPSTE